MAASVLEVTILRANLWSVGFRPVPIYNVEAGGPSPGKRPLGAQWQIDARADPPFCATHPAVPHATNTGILCDGLRAIDLDIDDRGKAKACSTLLVKMLGKAPARWRNNSPRVLALYRAAEGEPAKLSLTGRGHTKDCACKIEVLGRGQQFVAFGMHESGASLEWLPTQPGQEEYEDLTPVTEEQVLDFLTEAAKIIDAPPPALFGKGPVLFGRGPALNGANGHDTSVTTILLNPRRAMFEQIKVSNGGWHDLTRDWVAKMIARGYEPWAIEAMAASLTRPGYTVEQTLAEVRVMIEGAVGKGYAPDESGSNPVLEIIEPEKPSISATPLSSLDLSNIPPRQWIYGREIIKRFISVLASKGGTGKTAYTAVVALAIARGIPLLGIKIHKSTKVWILNLEDPEDELRRRILAAMLHHKIPKTDIDDRLFLDSGREKPLVIAIRDARGTLIVAPIVEALIEEINSREVGLMIIDPFLFSHQAEENSNDEMNRVMSLWSTVAERTNCAVWLIHHFRKGGKSGDDDSFRGAGVIQGAARSMYTLTTMAPEEAEKLGVPEEQRGFYVRHDNAKQNMAPPAGNAAWYRLVSVDIGNGNQDYPDGDAVQTIEPWNPSPFEDVTWAMIEQILHEIDQGPEPGEFYAMAKQAKERWAGRIIMERANRAEAPAAAILKTWKDNGVLEDGQYVSPKLKGRLTGCVRVNSIKISEMRQAFRTPNYDAG